MNTDVSEFSEDAANIMYICLYTNYNLCMDFIYHAVP